MSKIFIDTNILVYAADGREPLKQKKAGRCSGRYGMIGAV